MSFFNIILAIGRGRGSTPTDPNDFIPVIFELSQSNGGQAEAGRISLTEQIVAAGLTKMTYTEAPSNCRIWDKPEMDLIDDGVMEDIVAGVNTSQYNQARYNFETVCGAEMSLAPLLKKDSPNKSYYIKAMRGGSPLFQMPPTDDRPEDWNANSVNDLLDIALNFYAAPAIRQIIIENPGKQIKVALLRHQGESDNLDEERAAYYVNTTDFLNKIRNFQIDGVKYFENSPFLDTYLYYEPTQNQEILMNGVKEQFANDNANCYMIDIRNQPRKKDCTAAQLGGVPDSKARNEHGSYLTQLQKGENAYDVLKSISWI